LAPVGRALGRHDLHSASAGALRLRAKVKLLGLAVGTREGEYLLTAVAPDRWFEQTLFPGYSELVGVSGKERWRKRNVVDRPYRMHQLADMLNLALHLRLAPGAKLLESRQESVGGSPATCLKIGPTSMVWQKGLAGMAGASPVKLDEDSRVTLCFADATGDLVRADYGAQMGRYEYEGSLQLGAISYPKVLRCFEAKALAVEATIVELAAAPDQSEPSAFQPAKGADTWPECAQPVLPRLVVMKEVEPESFFKARRIFGTALMSAEVGVDGAIHEFGVVEGSAKGALGDAVRKAAEHWRYEPATCGGTPVPFQIYLAYTFRP
jgi:hypothetical protein